MSSAATKVCVECSTDKSAYKCPRCRAFYCSIKCCNQHKATCSSGSTISAEKASNPAVSTSAATNRPAVPVARPSPSAPTTSESALMDESMKQRLRSSKVLQDMLRNPRLQRKIASIDCEDGDSGDPAAKRAKGADSRQMRLKRARVNDAEFDAFVSTLLEEVGYGTRR